MRRAPVSLTLTLALLACAPAAPPQAVSEPERLALARLEAQRDAGTPALRDRSGGPTTPATLLAIRALGRTGDPPAIATLLTLLRAPDPELRSAAAEALGIAGLLGSDVRAAEPALLAAWPSAAPSEQRALATALGRIGSAAALPALTRALAPTAAPDLREAAALALGVLGRRKLALDSSARAALLALADAPAPALALAAAYALAQEHAPADRAPVDLALARLAAAPDPETRMVAVAGLARRKAAAVPIFTDALADPDWRVRVAAVRGLAGDDGDPALLALGRWLAAALAAPDLADGTGTIHPVLEALSLLTARPTAPPFPAAPLHDLAERRLADAAPAARPALARIACALASLAARAPDWRPPLRCAESAGLAARAEQLSFETSLLGLGRGGDPPARLARLSVLAADPDPRLRAAALTAAAGSLWTALPTDVEALLGHALEDSSPAVAGAAAEAVQARHAERRPAPGPALWRPLVDRAARERDGELFAALAGAIAAIDDPTGLFACLPALADPSPVVRAAARACVAALTDAEPDESSHPAPALPPFDPAAVLGAPLVWRLVTTRGTLDIELAADAAPWHVAALVALTRKGFYDGLRFHRVVPGFVVQGGDPHGTGWGGPGFQLPAEPGGARFDRGAVGIADAGKDTGGSQFFVMHARAPHLEGRYTHVGRVRAGLDVVDALIVGDTIVTATILD